MGSEYRARDGLVLRPSFGFGVTHVFRDTERTATDGSGPVTDTSSLTATPLAFRGFVGGALARDLLFGAVIGLAQSPAATFRTATRDSSHADGMRLGFVGLSLLYFFDSGSPWQIGATIAGVDWSTTGVTSRDRGPAGNDSSPHGGGILGSVELGYHFWIGQRFELGFVGLVDLGATQSGRSFRVAEVLVRSGDTSLLVGAELGVALAYY